MSWQDTCSRLFSYLHVFRCWLELHPDRLKGLLKASILQQHIYGSADT